MNWKILSFALAGALIASGCGDEGTGGTGSPSMASGAAMTATGGKAPGTAAGPEAGEFDLEAAVKTSTIAMNAGEFDKVLESYADDATWDIMGNSEPALEGKAAIKKSWEMLAGAFSGFHIAPIRVLAASEDLVITQSAWFGKHTGEFMGMAPTDKDVGVEYIAFQWMTDGKISKVEIYTDQPTLMKMVGGMPMPEGTPAPVPPEEATEVEFVMAPGNPDSIETTKKAFTAWAAADVEGFKAVIHPDVVDRDIGEGSTVTGADETVNRMKMFKAAFPDVTLEMNEGWAVGDYVVATFTMKGTHKGDLGPLKATGKPVELHGADVIRIAEGKATHIETYMNGIEMAMALGLMPPPGDAPAGDAPAGDAPAK